MAESLIVGGNASSAMIVAAARQTDYGNEDYSRAELSLQGMAKGDPEAVAVPDDEFTHAVESVMRRFHSLRLVLSWL
jgi:hypothetical protein